MRQGYIDPVVSNENTISTGPPGGGGASTLDVLAGGGPASFASPLASSSSLSLDETVRFAPLPPRLPLAAVGAFAGAGSIVGMCGWDGCVKVTLLGRLHAQVLSAISYHGMEGGKSVNRTSAMLFMQGRQ